MKLGLLLSISLVHLTSRRKQTLVAAMGVAFSIALFISLLSFMTGINNLLDGLMTRMVPHVTLTAETTNNQRIIDDFQPGPEVYHFVRGLKARGSLSQIRRGQTILNVIENDPRVKGVVPRMNSGVFFISGTTEINGLIKGVNMQEEVRLFGLNENIIEGKYEDLDRIPNGILIGVDLAKNLGLEVGKQLIIASSSGSKRIMKIVGIFQMGVKQVDESLGYISIGAAQSFTGKPAGFYTEIGVQLKDINKALAVSKEFQQRFSTKTIDFNSQNAQFETGSSIRTMISYAVGITLLIVAGFGIYNILNIMIYEKMNDIAILKATGFSSKDVNIIFISQGLIIGIIGGLLGLLAGFLLSYMVSTFPFSTPALPSMTTYPVNFNPNYYFLCMGFSLLTTFLAGYFPARKAGKIDPVEIIRNQ